MAREKTLTILSFCPICRTQFKDPTGGLMPTCGSPDCIREARAQGKPFTIPPRVSEKKTGPTEKRTRGKPRKKMIIKVALNTGDVNHHTTHLTPLEFNPRASSVLRTHQNHPFMP